MVVILTSPVVAPGGTVAVIWESETTLKSVAAVLLNFTVDTSIKFVPKIVTLVPTDPLVGEKPLTIGLETTVKFSLLVTAPVKVVTLTGPVVVPIGIVVVI